MANEGMGCTSLAYHTECKERREKSKQEEEGKIILLMEEENAVEAV